MDNAVWSNQDVFNRAGTINQTSRRPGENSTGSDQESTQESRGVPGGEFRKVAKGGEDDGKDQGSTEETV
jgi:hypothetical protein